MNIFVGNLNFEVTENELGQLFQEYGSVERVSLVKDRDSGQTRGFAFIEMVDDGRAERAIEALNGTVLKKQALRVNEARPRHEALNGEAPVERRKMTRQDLDTRSHRKHRY